jgi:hypothetical protein
VIGIALGMGTFEVVMDDAPAPPNRNFAIHSEHHKVQLSFAFMMDDDAQETKAASRRPARHR